MLLLLLQVINHGVPHDVMIEMRASCSSFFQQPPEMRNIYRSQSFDDPLAYSTSFNPAKEKANDWKDVLYVRDFPGNPVDGFGIAPDVCRFHLTLFYAFFQTLCCILFLFYICWVLWGSKTLNLKSQTPRFWIREPRT